MPLWNEVLAIPIISLPCSALITLCASKSCRRVELGENSDCASFAIDVTENLLAGFGEERLVSSSIQRCSNSCLPEGAEVRLRVSCSLDRKFVAVRQQGLWPLSLSGVLYGSARSHLLQQTSIERERDGSAHTSSAFADVSPGPSHQSPCTSCLGAAAGAACTDIPDDHDVGCACGPADQRRRPPPSPRGAVRTPAQPQQEPWASGPGDGDGRRHLPARGTLSVCT